MKPAEIHLALKNNQQTFQLSAITDFLADVSDFNANRNAGNKELAIALQKSDSAAIQLSYARNVGLNAIKKLDAIEAQSKELGVDLPKNVIDGGQDVRTLMAQIDKNLKALAGFKF